MEIGERVVSALGSFLTLLLGLAMAPACELVIAMRRS